MKSYSNELPTTDQIVRNQEEIIKRLKVNTILLCLCAGLGLITLIAVTIHSVN